MMNETTKPAPPVPVDLDLRSFEYMPLHVQRLRDSDLAVLSSGDEFRAAVLLWAAAWHQIPASSLPCDDRLLAKLAGYGRDIDGWLMVRETALRGFIECSDGRLYHHVIAATALSSAKNKWSQKNRTQAATAARLAKQRDEQRDVARDEHQEKRKEKKEDGGDAPARETGVNVSREAIELANELCAIAGHDVKFMPPSWCGAALRVQTWFNTNPEWTREIIITAAKAAMMRKVDGPPNTINYFEKPISRLAQQQSAPVSTAEVRAYETDRDRHPRPGPGWQQSRDGFRAARAKLKAGIAEAEGSLIERGEGD